MTRNHEPVYGIGRLHPCDAAGGSQESWCAGHHDRRRVPHRHSEGSGRSSRSSRCIPVDREDSREKLLRYLYAADLYVSSSHSDGTSVSLLEAMAGGLSAVLTDVPSNLEWITNGENGEVVPRSDHDALARAILTMAIHPNGMLRTDGAASRSCVHGETGGELPRYRNHLCGTDQDEEAFSVRYTQTPCWTSLQRLDAWLVRHEYKGYDPFDGLSSYLRPLTLYKKFPQQVLQQGVRRIPWNLRPLLASNPTPAQRGWDSWREDT